MKIVILLLLLGHELPLTLPGAALYDAPHGAKIQELAEGRFVFPEYCVLWQYDGVYELYAETADGFIMMSKHYSVDFSGGYMSVYYVTGQCREDGRETFLYLTPGKVKFGSNYGN